MNNYRIGFDPGLSGAIAILSEHTINFHSMPTTIKEWAKPKRVMKLDKAIGRKKWTGKYTYPQRIDSKGIARILTPYRGLTDVVNIEEVQANPNDGKVGAFTFGGTFYSIISVLEVMDIDFKTIRPQAWKAKWGLIGMEKDDSRKVVLNMYPDLAEDLKYKKDGGKAEALLIAMS